MKLRKIVSLTASLSFIMMVLTSLLLYIAPQGRVAYWSDWRFWGLDKTQWGNIHVNVGLLFLISLALHLYYNWTPLISYLKNRSKQLVITTREFSVAAILIILTIAGTYAQIPPFAYVQQLNDFIKDSAAARHGEPPYGHAELSSLKTLSTRMGFESAKALKELAKAGIHAENENLTILEIARLNQRTPKEIYDTIVASNQSLASDRKSLPDHPQPGFGKQTLEAIAAEYQLSVNKILDALNQSSIRVSSNMTIKDIASANRVSPLDVYEMIKQVAGEDQK